MHAVLFLLLLFPSHHVAHERRHVRHLDGLLFEREIPAGTWQACLQKTETRSWVFRLFTGGGLGGGGDFTEFIRPCPCAAAVKCFDSGEKIIFRP